MRKKTKKQPIRRPPARAADVLSASAAAPPVKLKWQKHYRRLVELRNYLLTRRGDLAKGASEERPTFSMHMADAATDTFDRDLALSMASLEQDALYEIDEALNRIRDGTYGKCELTGKPIEPERLDAIPWTRFSAAAEKELEEKGGVSRARLRPRDKVLRESATFEVEEGEEGEES